MIMSVTEIQQLPTEDKLQIMQTLWEEMHQRFESSQISPELSALLQDRRARVARGEVKLLDWDSVKFAIGRG
jgi:Putative addiction module component